MNYILCILMQYGRQSKMNKTILPKEVQYEEINTPHGIFTSNTHLGLTAQEVYEKWLYDKENPKPVLVSNFQESVPSRALGPKEL